MTLRDDKRRLAGRRGRSRGVDGQRVRRDTQAGTTLEDHGKEFKLQGGKIRLNTGAGLSQDPSTGTLDLDLDLQAPLVAAEDGQVQLALAASRGLKVRADKLELVEMEPIAGLTDSTAGVPDGTLNLINGSGDDAAINKNFAELAAKVNDLLAKLRATDRLRE